MENVIVVGRQPQGLWLRCQVCGAEIVASCSDCVETFKDEHQHLSASHLGLGDLVAAGIKSLFGIKPCPACRRRKRALNRAAPKVWRR